MSVWLQVCFWALTAAIAAWVLVTAVRNGKPVRRLLSSGAQGLCAWAAVNLAGAFTGVSLGLSWFSGAVCLLLGVPGVIALVLLQIVFPI